MEILWKLPQKQPQKSSAQNWSHLSPAICQFSKIRTFILVALGSKDRNQRLQDGNLVSAYTKIWDAEESYLNKEGESKAGQLYGLLTSINPLGLYDISGLEFGYSSLYRHNTVCLAKSHHLWRKVSSL